MIYYNVWVILALVLFLDSSYGAGDGSSRQVQIAAGNKKMKVHEGSNVNIRCTSGHGDAVIWQRNDKELSGLNYTYTTTPGKDVDVHNLRITGIGFKEGTNYQCKNSKNFTNMDTAVVTVSRDEALMLKENPASTLSEDDGVSLICSTGKSWVEMEWYYNSNRLTASVAPEVSIGGSQSADKSASTMNHRNPDTKISWTYFCRDKTGSLADSNPYEIIREVASTNQGQGSGAPSINTISTWLALTSLSIAIYNL